MEGGAEQDPKNEFLKCFENWKKRWHKGIMSKNDYFEWDKVDIRDIF